MYASTLTSYERELRDWNRRRRHEDRRRQLEAEAAAAEARRPALVKWAAAAMQLLLAAAALLPACSPGGCCASGSSCASAELTASAPRSGATLFGREARSRARSSALRRRRHPTAEVGRRPPTPPPPARPTTCRRSRSRRWGETAGAPGSLPPRPSGCRQNAADGHVRGVGGRRHGAHAAQLAARPLQLVPHRVPPPAPRTRHARR